MHGSLHDGERREFDGAALDSRRVRPEQLFFALEGERTDGHRFVGDAASRGAAGAVVHRDVTGEAGELPLIRVADTYDALHALTRHVRRQVPERLVAVTGSVGKTTTKEILATLLERRFRVAKSEGNLNNLYGFPLSLLSIPDGTEWMVAEMGMSTPGELAEISRLGRPDVALFTNVKAAHLESFDSLAAIAAAKAELLEGLAEDGWVAANAADPEVVGIGRRHEARGGRVTWFTAGESVGPRPTVRATDLRPRREGVGHLLTLEHEPAGGPTAAVEIALPLHGRYNVDNFVAAAAVALGLGVELEEVAAAAAALAPAAMRGVVRRLAGQVTLVDDAYNSNPWALERALEAAAELPARRRWAVLGEMLELGETAPALHREAGVEAARRGFDPIVGVGELARHLIEGAGAHGVETRWYADAAAAAAQVPGELRRGDLLLVKGSRGIGLERVVEAITGLRDEEEA